MSKRERRLRMRYPEQRQQYRRAYAIFREALRVNPDLVSARAAIVEIYRASGNRDWAAYEQAAIVRLDCTMNI